MGTSGKVDARLALVTAISCWLSYSTGSQLIAWLGLTGGFATPLLVSTGSDRPIGLFAYILVLDLGFQMLDLSLWTLGNPAVESATASLHRSRKGEVEDSATAFFRLATGATLTLEVTWGLLMEKDFHYLNLFGSGGAALLNPFRVHKGMHGTLVNVTPTLDSSRNQYKYSIEAQIAHFADVLRENAKPMGHADEILPVMELMDAVYRSAEQGKEVRLG